MTGRSYYDIISLYVYAAVARTPAADGRFMKTVQETSDIIIRISHLNKSYGDLQAVSDLSFHVKRGEFFAFLGINGAGKSTTISVMCGELDRDSGEVIIDGKNIDTGLADIRRKIGVVFQNSILDRDLTVLENLEIRAALYGIRKPSFRKRLAYLSDVLDFRDILGQRYCTLSGGQKRKIDIARALLHDPDILILDEPTTGIDPQTRRRVWGMIRRLREERGLTVFLTTHYMEEVSDADYVVILNKGKIAAEGRPLDLKNRFAGDYINLYHLEEDEVRMLGLPYRSVPDGFRVEVPGTDAATQLILSHPGLFRDYEIIKGNMDDVFLSATGIRLDEEI